ncbi:MAG: peptidoglycan/LPS O-acetylase OafA/YrhL, partial [Candidatus Binatia bacterium]
MYSRLNYLRFVLAWAVLAYHAFLPAFPMAGMLAVWCFFLISGFLVSNILYGRYNNRPKDFLTNRFLRIFPTYWTALFLGLCLVLYQADTPPGLPFELFAPSTFIQWWRNIFLFGSAGTHIFQWVVAPAGSLSLELTWYLILFVGSFFPRKWLLTFLFAMLTVPFILALHFDESIE